MSPLSDAGHISIMVDSAPCRSACRCLSCLEIHKLLQCSREVVYPEGLNGGFEPIQVPLPKQSVWNVESTDEPCYVANKSPQHHPWRCNNGCLSMVVDAYFLSTLCYRVSDTVTRLSMGEEVEKLFVWCIVQHTRTVSCTCFPQETTTCGTQHCSSWQGESPFQFRRDKCSLSKAITSLPT